MSEIAILIPTINRADVLEALVQNAHDATETPHRVYLIMEATDFASIGVAHGLDAIRIVGDFGSCAKAVNEGFRLSCEPYFAVANDDVRFHAGWDKAALARFTDTTHVVGLNDGSGDCKCFTLARRRYIEDHSGVYDKPATVYHDGYKSQCVDTEFAHYAMLRGVWADAPDALLEHVHWRFGKADRDHPNYEKARATNAEDLEEYERRWAEWDPDHRMPRCVPGAVMAR